MAMVEVDGAVSGEGVGPLTASVRETTVGLEAAMEAFLEALGRHCEALAARSAAASAAGLASGDYGSLLARWIRGRTLHAAREAGLFLAPVDDVVAHGFGSEHLARAEAGLAAPVAAL